ncbi:hypothetical protein PPBDW_II0304 [Photobacterium kishitanii]|nr:hypothetical protein PPBDW_II0304 [Photobacterium kishitanii]
MYDCGRKKCLKIMTRIYLIKMLELKKFALIYCYFIVCQISKFNVILNVLLSLLML